MLNLKWKNILLSLHIIFASILIGSLLIITILILIKDSYFLPSQYQIIDKIIFILHDSIVVNISLLITITGLMFSAFTKWGFIKFRWIIFKWTAIIFAAVIIMFLLGRAINGAAALSYVYGQDVSNNNEYIQFVNERFVYTMILSFLFMSIVFISVVKPWGKRKERIKPNRKYIIAGVIISAIFLTSCIVLQYLELERYRNLTISNVDLLNVGNGSYLGEAEYGFDYKVKVQVKEHRIIDISIIRNRNSFYPKLAENIMCLVLKEQKNDVDALTGATTTSKVLLKAIEQALINHKKEQN